MSWKLGTESENERIFKNIILSFGHNNQVLESKREIQRERERARKTNSQKDRDRDAPKENNRTVRNVTLYAFLYNKL